jgi:hypothetical protein
MAKDLTPYQRRIVDRYYQHKDTIHATKLSEIVSEIAVESDPKRLDRLWKTAGDYLAKCGVEAATIAAAIPARNLPLLGQVAGAIMSGKRPPVAERTQRRA